MLMFLYLSVINSIFIIFLYFYNFIFLYTLYLLINIHLFNRIYSNVIRIESFVIVAPNLVKKLVYSSNCGFFFITIE